MSCVDEKEARHRELHGHADSIVSWRARWHASRLPDRERATPLVAAARVLRGGRETRTGMFELARLTDTVHITPNDFAKPLVAAISDALFEKFANKVVPSLGLCITLHDILHVGEAMLYPGNGSQHIVVEFRFVVFRPYEGEVLLGTIVASDPLGMRVSLGFFDEIHVPKRLLQTPSSWSDEEGVLSLIHI